MGVELRRGVAVDWPYCVVLEGCGHELACGLRFVDVPDPRLRELLELAQSNTDAFPMRQAHPLIAAHKRSERNRLRRRDGPVPAGAVLDARHFPADLVFVRLLRLMANQLLARPGMLAFRQPREFFIANRAFEIPLLRQLALPVLALVVLLLGCELPRVIHPRLTC